jgi:hypothetical protein
MKAVVAPCLTRSMVVQATCRDTACSVLPRARSQENVDRGLRREQDESHFGTGRRVGEVWERQPASLKRSHRIRQVQVVPPATITSCSV